MICVGVCVCAYVCTYVYVLVRSCFTYVTYVNMYVYQGHLINIALSSLVGEERKKERKKERKEGRKAGRQAGRQAGIISIRRAYICSLHVKMDRGLVTGRRVRRLPPCRSPWQRDST